MFQLTWKNKTAWQQAAAGDALEKSPAVANVESIAWLDWEEHCVECAAPACYTSCSLFKKRRDNKCARFVYGIYPHPNIRGQFRYGADIMFRPWAKLQARWPGQPSMRSLTRSRMEERGLRFIDWSLDRLADLMSPLYKRRIANGANTWLRRFLAKHCGEKSNAPSNATPNETETKDNPDALLLVVWSPQQDAIDLQLEISTDRPVYRKGLKLQSGWNHIEIPFAEIAAQTNGQPGRILLWMNNQQNVRLIFSWLGLVKFRSRQSPVHQKPQPAKHIKCVAWDLDNTLWNGVIGDDGADSVSINDQFVDLIRQFDERGILQTIVSKNTWDVAWPKIESLGLAPYFLYPAIHWGPKSESLKSIAAELNINIDTFAVIDDNPFERREISHALPQVRTYDPLEFDQPFARPEFQLPVSPESRLRRASYQAEAKRRRVHSEHRGDFSDFLAGCNMVLHIATPTEQEIPRCLELVQRSNQFNLSTRRYADDDFRALLSADDTECFALRVDDDFGSYGIIGFCAVRIPHTSMGGRGWRREASRNPGASFAGSVQPRPPVAEDSSPKDANPSTAQTILIDFVLSCRVAQKTVEEAFLHWYARQLQQRGQAQLTADLTITDRNKPLRDELARIGFTKTNNTSTDESSHQRTLQWQWTSESINAPHVIQIDDTAVVSRAEQPQQTQIPTEQTPRNKAA